MKSETDLTASRSLPQRLKNALPGEDTWRVWAVSLSLASLLLAVAAVAFIAAGENELAQLRRTQIIQPFAIFYAGIITFCTVVWRGLISARQADYQQRQMDAAWRQIALSDETGLAQQLQKGAELLADDKPVRVGAGIAILGTVAKSGKDELATAARALLLDYVVEFGARTHEVEMVTRCIEQLRMADAVKQLLVRERVTFDGSWEDEEYHDEPAEWQIIPGVKRLNYHHGVIYKQTINDDINASFFRIRFMDCVIVDLSKLDLTNCVFVQCDIERAKISTINANTFRKCRFSKAEIYADKPFSSDGSVGNEYLIGMPPRLYGPHATTIQLSSFLTAAGSERLDEDDLGVFS